MDAVIVQPLAGRHIVSSALGFVSDRNDKWLSRLASVVDPKVKTKASLFIRSGQEVSKSGISLTITDLDHELTLAAHQMWDV